MNEAAAVASVHLSNATAAPLSVWLEPWIDEFALPPRSELALHVTMPSGQAPMWPEIDSAEDLLTIYGPGGSLIRVEIDGVVQESCSATMMAPNLGPLTMRSFVNMAFGDFPEARPGGLPVRPIKRGWFSRLFRRE